MAAWKRKYITIQSLVCATEAVQVYRLLFCSIKGKKICNKEKPVEK